MTRIQSAAVVVTALVFLASPASALIVTNGDDVDQKIAIVTDSDRGEHEIAVGQQLEIACDPNCSVSIMTDEGDEGTIEAASADRLTIKGSQLIRAQ